ncbi:MAG: ABC transporter permease [Acidimicrobiales bacterium]
MALPTLLRATEREARVWSKLWVSSLFSTVVAPVLLLVAMGLGLGSLVDTDPGELGGLDYIEFIAPGLLVATAVQTASGTSLWPVMAGQKWLGFYHAMVSSPMSPTDVFGGQVIWNSIRSMMGAVVFVLAAAALGAVSSPAGVLAVAVAGLTAMAFAAPLAAFAATQDSDAKFDVIIRMGIVPLYLFSGTLFPIDQLPLGLRAVASVFPMWHGVELARSATTGTFTLADAGHLLVLAVFIVAGWWWGARTFTRRLAL